MHELDFEGYEQWDLAPASLPPRSVLSPLQPMGLATPLVESLSSYITRLADAHAVFAGLLMRKVVAPFVPAASPLEKQRGLFRASGQRSRLLNGTGLPAKYAVQALEVLTLRSDLHYLTLLPLAAIFPTRARGLLRLTKAWCPICYENQRRAGLVIYDPLLWFFLDVALCPEHCCILRTECPYQDCAKSLPAVGWRARPGYCSYCQRWLGLAREHVKEMSDVGSNGWRWQRWVTQTLGEVLASIPSQSVLPERQRIRQVVMLAVEQLGAGNIMAFTKALGFPRNSVNWWYQGKRIPESTKLLWFCYRTGISLNQFLFDGIDKLVLSLQEPFLSKPPLVKRGTFDAVQVYQAREQVLARSQYPLGR